MDCKFCLILLLAFMVYNQYEAKRNYKGYFLLEMNIGSSKERNNLYKWKNKDPRNIEILKHIEKSSGVYPVRVIAHTKAVDTLKETYPGWIFTATKFKLDQLIKEETQEVSHESFEIRGYHFGKHNSYTQIQNYLTEAEVENIKLISVSDIGKTYEKRSVAVVEIGKSPKADKKVIIFECGIHAREWLSIEMCMYIIHKFEVLSKKENGAEKQLLKHYNFIILPVVNPDGFIYSWKTDRLWNKNRRPGYGRGKMCTGVDINKNFDIDHCSDDIHQNFSCNPENCGINPFSELESIAVQLILSNHKDNIQAYFSIHSSGTSIWGMPYAYTGENPSHPRRSTNFQEHLQIANAAVQTVEQVRRTKMEVGRVFELWQKNSGSSMDYAYIKALSRYAYLIDIGDFFLHPQEEILPILNATYQGLIRAMQLMKRD